MVEGRRWHHRPPAVWCVATALACIVLHGPRSRHERRRASDWLTLVIRHASKMAVPPRTENNPGPHTQDTQSSKWARGWAKGNREGCERGRTSGTARRVPEVDVGRWVCADVGPPAHLLVGTAPEDHAHRLPAHATSEAGSIRRTPSNPSIHHDTQEGQASAYTSGYVWAGIGGAVPGAAFVIHPPWPT